MLTLALLSKFGIGSCPSNERASQKQIGEFRMDQQIKEVTPVSGILRAKTALSLGINPVAVNIDDGKTYALNLRNNSLQLGNQIHNQDGVKNAGRK